MNARYSSRILWLLAVIVLTWAVVLCVGAIIGGAALSVLA